MSSFLPLYVACTLAASSSSVLAQQEALIVQVQTEGFDGPRLTHRDFEQLSGVVADGDAVDISIVSPLRNSVGMLLQAIPAGEFTRAVPDEPTHKVQITKAFWLGVYEVTVKEWTAVMGGHAPAIFDDNKSPTKDHPTTSISWHDAMDFCRELSKLEAERGNRRVYRLPTEAEWEYACRAGTQTKWSFGDGDARLSRFCNCERGTRRSLSNFLVVGSLKPNPWGLHDMHGNVWEWCSDWYGPYPKDAVADPKGPKDGERRVYRGGSGDAKRELCLPNFRGAGPPDYKLYNLGLRVAMDVTAPAPAVD